MGIVCCGEEVKKTSVTPIPDTIKDLPPVDPSKLSCAYEKYEATFPFNRTLLAVMNQKIDEADEACGGEGAITLQSLRKALPTPAWAPLNDPGSNLALALLSEQFKDAKKGTPSDKIDVDILKMFALLHCVGTSMDKAKAFYGCLQEGGLEAHE